MPYLPERYSRSISQNYKTIKMSDLKLSTGWQVGF